MNKRLIRLTEGDLHRIVKESVNRLLTELDWKTYASAAQKSNQRYFNGGHNDKDLKRVRKFSDAAVNSFKEKYPEVVNQKDRKFEPYCDAYGMGYNAERTEPYSLGASKLKANRHTNNMSDRVDYTQLDKNGNELYSQRNSDINYPYNDIEQKAVRDLDNFSRVGDYWYKKGKR